MFDFVTIGGATRDIFFKTDKDWVVKNKDPLKQRLMCFEYGAKVVPRETHFSFGGGALNTAVSFSRLGLDAAAIVELGDDEIAEVILNYLKKENIKVASYWAENKSQEKTGISVIVVDQNGDHTAILYRGTNDKLKIKNWDWLKETKWVYISSLTGESDDVLSKLEREISKYKTRLVWNPGSVQLKKGFRGLKKLLAKTEVLILNKDEALELVFSKEKIKDCNNARGLVLKIKEWGPKAVLVTNGKNGAYASLNHEVFYVPSLKTRIQDTTGAGDAFGSSFVAGLEIYKNDIKKALALATVNAASVVSHFGAQNGLLPLNKAKKLITKVKVKESKN